VFALFFTATNVIIRPDVNSARHLFGKSTVVLYCSHWSIWKCSCVCTCNIHGLYRGLQSDNIKVT